MRWAALGVILILAAAAVGHAPPPTELFLRVFKREGELEVWGRHGPGAFTLCKTYVLTAASGAPGPKRREGDLQVPEGFYEVDLLNPQSRFHLSMRVNYPNAADRILSDREHPGSDIYIHGGAASIGCLPVGDAGIDEIYDLVQPVFASGRPIHVHIFPARMAGTEWEKWSAFYPQFAAFWAELQPGFAKFEKTHRVPAVTVSADGKYHVE